MDLALQFSDYAKYKSLTEKLLQKDLHRRSLLNNAQLLKTILIQQLSIDEASSKKNHNNSSIKQDLTKAQHEKKLLDNKILLLNTEIDNLKKKAANQTTLQKDNLSLKNQLAKLNSQLNESRNEIGKAKQQFVTQKAVLESKLENAKKNIKNLKDSKSTNQTSPTKTIPTLVSPIKLNQTKPANGLILKKPLISDFSVSPFLHKAIKSPTKEAPVQTPTAKAISTPVNNNILAQSTPGTSLVSPLKRLTAAKGTRGPSGLKNLLSPERNPVKPTAASDTQKKKTASLFDDEEEEDKEDLFSSSVRKVKEKEADVTVSNPNKKKKRKLGGKAIIEEEDAEEDFNPGKFSPLKKVKLMDKIGGISPLKQRNKERNLFKV